MTRLDIPADWRTWLETNRARGCTEASMLDAMLRAGIDEPRARSWLAAVSVAALRTNAANTNTTGLQVDTGEAYRYGRSHLPQHNVVQLDGLTVRIAMRMQKPDVALIENFLRPDECDAMIALAQSRLKGSTVVDPGTGDYVINPSRSSEGAMLQRGETPLVQIIEQRIAALVNWPVDNAEGLQVLHYRPGGEYRPHYDYFPPDKAGGAAQLRVGGQRIATLIMYLNDVAGGGATIFPELGLDVAARKGSAVWFSYCNDAGELDAKTLHGGAPVVAGEKWIATKWLRERRYG